MSDDEEGEARPSINIPVELGYVEEVGDSPLRLHSAFFNSKIGGKPSWLGLNPLPKSSNLTCAECSDPLIFLCQIYAPVCSGLDDQDYTFHRTIFVFLCRKPECCGDGSVKNFKVFRSQLARKNKFYSYEALSVEDYNTIDELPTSINHSVNLCQVCGCEASKKCANCVQTWYCSQAHQVLDWKLGKHKQLCSRVKTEGPQVLREDVNNAFLFPEFELVTETEELEEVREEERGECARLADYRKYLEDLKSSGKPVLDVEDHLDEDIVKVEDVHFKKFREVVDQNPEQVIRYQRGGGPLWAFPNQVNVPDCETCGGKRVFEFQIMPHLLAQLKLDSVEKSIDWATVAVYTCEKCCNPEEEGDYVQEFLIKQDFCE